MRTFIFLVFIFFMACESGSNLQKPENFIPEETMEKILFDLALLKSIKRSSYKKRGDAVFNDQYLYRKYAIDEETFLQNQQYYAQNPKLLSALYERVDKRFDTVIDSVKNLADEKQQQLKVTPDDPSDKELLVDK